MRPGIWLSLLIACRASAPDELEVARQPLDVQPGAVQKTSTTGEPLTTMLGSPSPLSATCGATNCTVVWSDDRPGAPGLNAAGATFMDRLDDRATRGLIAGIPGSAEHLVAWQTRDSPPLVYSAVLTESFNTVRAVTQLSTGSASVVAVGADENLAVGLNLVLWHDDVGGGIRATRVDPDGGVRDGPGGVLLPLDPFASGVAVVWDGVSYVIANVTGPFNAHDIELTSLGRDGGPTGHRVLALPGDQTAVALARVRPGSMLAWTTDIPLPDAGRSSSLSWALLSATSAGLQTVLDGGTLASSEPRWRPRLTLTDSSDAGEVIIASWVEGFGLREVKASTFVRLTGQFLAPVTLAGQQPGAADCSTTQAAQNDAGCLLSYTDHVLTAGPSSQLPHHPQLFTTTDAPLAGLAYGNVAAIVIEAKRIQRQSLNAAPALDPFGLVGTLFDTPAQQVQPAVVWTGSSYLALWSQLTTSVEPFSYLDVRGEQFGVDGLGSGGFDAVKLPDGQLQPAAAANDAGVLVVWTELPPSGDTSRVKFRLVDPNGNPRSAIGSVTRGPSPQRWPGAGNVGELFGLAWYDQGTRDGGPFGAGDLYLGTVDRSGQVLSIAFLDDSVIREPASFANAGSQALVAWNKGSNIRGARVAADGGLLDAAPIALSSSPASPFGAPTAVFTGAEYVVLWDDERAGNPGLYARRLTIDGTAQGPLSGDLVASGSFNHPNAVWDGHDIFVSWVESLSDGGTAPQGNWWRPGQTWDTDAGVQLLGGPLVADFYASPGIRVATNGQRNVLVAAERTVTTFGHPNSARIHVQTFQTGRRRGLSCTTSDECSSGACREDVCCDPGCTDACQTCRVDAGALTEGQCGFRKAGSFCRASSGGDCDVDDTCSGSSAACPDLFSPSTKECRAATVACDAPESCTGLDPTCPQDRPAPATTECHPKDPNNPCDVRELCSGNDKICPADGFAPQGTVCGGAQVCNAAGACADCVGTQCDVFDAGQQMMEEKPTRSLYGALQCSCGETGGLPGLMVLLAFWLRRRRGLALAAALLAMLGGAAAVHAEERKSLAFMGLRGADEASAKALSKLFESELVATGAYRVISQDDLVALIGIERQRQLLGCTEDAPACAAELAGALDADRVLLGTLAEVSGETIVDVSLLDRTAGKAVGRATRRLKGGISSAFDEVVPMLKELLRTDPALKERELKFKRTFGGVVLGLRGEGDVLGRGFAPAATVELSARLVGFAVTVLYGNGRFGGRLEGRFYPFIAGPIRPYVAAGVTALVPAVSVRGALGAAAMLWRLQLFVDVAYEHFFNVPSTYFADALLISGGVGWHF